MTISTYDASVTVCVRTLGNLIGILDKGAAHCDAHGIDPAVLINARLYPDMFPLARQVQVATDIARRGGARLAGREPDSVPDTESTFPELIDRVRSVIGFLESLSPEQMDGAEDRRIKFILRGREMTFEGRTFLLDFVLPNVFFHVTTAYAILRHNGVELGKPDYLGSF